MRDRPHLSPTRARAACGIDGRDALQQLIDDVQSGGADFQVILVYDVSRWGRFQDADESAYYEYICKRAGIARALLRRAVRERRQPGLDHRQGRQAGDGRRVQPRAVGQGLRGPVPADRARATARAAPPASGCGGCCIDQHGQSRRPSSRRGEQKSLQTDRVDPGARARRTRSPSSTGSTACSSRTARPKREIADDLNGAGHRRPTSAGRGRAAPCIRC